MVVECVLDPDPPAAARVTLHASGLLAAGAGLAGGAERASGTELAAAGTGLASAFGELEDGKLPPGEPLCFGASEGAPAADGGGRKPFALFTPCPG